MKKFFQLRAVRETCKTLAFLGVVLLLLCAFRSLFRFKHFDGNYILETFYEQEENTVDVLFLGSSHVFESFHTGVLYDEFGIASYNLGSSVQPLWNSYHYLIEALKTQTPSLVVLEGYILPSEELIHKPERIIKNTFGFKPSLNQLENLRVSVPEGEFWEYFFQFYSYHNRYDSDISPEDYYPDQGMKIYEDWKGFLPNYRPNPYDVPYGLGATGTLPLVPKTETYYRKIIELCQSLNIPLHIVVVPYYMTEQEQMRMNRAAEIAQEYGVPFTDYNGPGMHEMLDFDYARDMAHGNHLITDASIRFSRAVGEMLCAAYDIPDRRGDERYASWARSAAFYARDLANHKLGEISQLEPYLARVLEDDDYTVFISTTGFLSSHFDEIVAWLAPFGIDDIYYEHAMNGTWATRGGEVISRWQPGMRYPYVQLENCSVTFDEGYFCLVDREPALRTERGINIVVYDHVTQSVADIVGFQELSGFTAVR